VLVWEEDGEELSTSTSVQEMTALVDGVETLTLVQVSAVKLVIMARPVLLQLSSLMLQVIRECVVKQEDTRKEHQLAFSKINRMDRQ